MAMTLAENFELFGFRLDRAIQWAVRNPDATEVEKKAAKDKLKGGLTNGQYRIVVMAFNSIYQRREFQKKKQKPTR